MNIKAISLNIWQGELLTEAIDFLKGQDADIVMLQEVYDGSDPSWAEKYHSLSILKNELGYEYFDFGLAYEESTDFGRIPHGNAVFSKFPIVSSGVTLMVASISPSFQYWDRPDHWPLLPAPLQHVKLETKAGEINVFNMHGVWDLDGDSYSDRRQKMEKSIIEAFKGLPNVILAGDSNAKASNKAMTNLENHLTSVFGQQLKSTFNMRRKDNPGYATAAVDHMFVSSNIQVLSKECPDIDVSDHLPLVVTLKVS